MLAATARTASIAKPSWPQDRVRKPLSKQTNTLRAYKLKIINNKSSIKKLIITDSLPIRDLGPKVETLSVSYILADAIKRNHDGRSIGDMFN